MAMITIMQQSREWPTIHCHSDAAVQAMEDSGTAACDHGKTPDGTGKPGGLRLQRARASIKAGQPYDMPEQQQAV